MSTVNTRREQIAASLKDKPYRDAFVGSLIRVRLPAQIRALRRARKWSQAELAKACGMRQSQISRYEQLGHDEFSLATLKRLASAFDVGLGVSFVPYSQLVDDAAYPDLSPLEIKSFADDAGLNEPAGGNVNGFSWLQSQDASGAEGFELVGDNDTWSAAQETVYSAPSANAYLGVARG